MKPKNLIFCIGCQKSKMLFESKAKADNFIKYNSKDIYEEKGKAPVRSYYCEMCGGFHVTSNPSEKAGEKLNQRDQKVISQVELGIKESEKYGSLQQSILEKIEIAKKQMYAGNFQYVEQLHDDIYRDSEFAFKLPLDKRSKYIALRQRIEILYKVSLLFKEINHTHVLIQNNEIEEAQSNIMVLHQQSANLKGGMFADVISKCQQNIKKVEKELSNKIANMREANPVAEHSTHTFTAETTYRTKILYIIDKIEQVQKFYELNDFDSCESQLEIAEFLIEELGIEDDNIKLLKSQIELWKQKNC